jgi:hypothetical protein
VVNPQEAGDKQKPINSDKLQVLIMQEWAAICHVARKLIDSMPGRIAEVLKKKGGSTLQILTASTSM